MSTLHYLLRVSCVAAGIALATVSLGSCKLAQNQLTFDRAAEKDIQDFRDVMAPGHLPPGDADSGAPDFQPVIATPDDLRLPDPLVTVSVNQTVSLRDLMFELAEQADVDLEMDPQIRGSIIFTAKERPFNEVVERIAEMSGLRYKFENNVLRIELDRPFVKNYRVDYMNVARKSSSGISTSISTSGTTDSASTTGGSNSQVGNTYDGDFWKEIDTGLKQILTASDTYLSLATMADPVAVAVAPPLPPVDPNNPNAPPPPASTTPPSLNVSVPAASSEPLIPNAPATYSISKQTGIVSVFASERQQKQVQKFLNTLLQISMTQILIEARVLEVALTDEYATGIDWGRLHNLTGLISLNPTFGAPSMTPNASNTFTANINFGNDFRPVIEALSRYGTVRALSSPRVTVMNNQPAVVSVAENKVYFKIDVTSNTSGTPPVTTTTYNTTQKSIPEGVLLNVIPTADAETGEVILAVRPTVSKQITTVNDPIIALTFAAAGLPVPAGVSSSVPQVSVQEIDSVVKMQSGQTLVMGGLMKDQNTTSQEGVPVLGDVPLVGNLFRNHGDKIIKSELVIFLKATIVPGSTVDDMDRKLYKSFGVDHRPVRM